MKANERLKKVKTREVAQRTVESDYILDQPLLDSMKSLAYHRLGDENLANQVVAEAITGLQRKKNINKVSCIIRPWLAVYIDRICSIHESNANNSTQGKVAKVIPLFGSKYQSIQEALSPLNILNEAKSDLNQFLNPDHMPAA